MLKKWLKVVKKFLKIVFGSSFVDLLMKILKAEYYVIIVTNIFICTFLIGQARKR